MNTKQKTNKNYQMITDNIIDNLIDNKPITDYQKRILLFLLKSNTFYKNILKVSTSITHIFNFV